jgi:hypothetical protein
MAATLRELALPKLARWQPYVRTRCRRDLAVHDGRVAPAPGHHPSEAIFTFDYPATAFLMVGLNGITALTAAVGGIV